MSHLGIDQSGEVEANECCMLTSSIILYDDFPSGLTGSGDKLVPYWEYLSSVKRSTLRPASMTLTSGSARASKAQFQLPDSV